MLRKRRFLLRCAASRIHIASPLALLVSGSFLTPDLRAHQLMPTDLPPLTSPGESAQARLSQHRARISFNSKLLLNTSILDSRDSKLMRQLLLTYGIELDLSQYADQQFVDKALLNAIFSSQKLGKPPSFKLVVADASGRIQHDGTAPSACEPGISPEELNEGVSKSWKVLWIGSCEAVTQTKKSLPPEGEAELPPVTKPRITEAEVEPEPAAQIHQTQQATAKQINESPESAIAETNKALQEPESAALAPGLTPPSAAIKRIDPAQTTRIIPALDIDLGGDLGDNPASDLDTANAGSGTGSGLGISDDVPPGFEALAGPQTNYIDIHFNGQKVGTSSITSTPEDVQFDNPVEVAAMLPNISDPLALETLLAEPLPSNGDKACFAENDPPGCGQVEATPVAVIYNEADLIVEIFIAPELQEVQARDLTRYLAPPERKNSSILSFYAVTSDLEDEETSTDMALHGVAGYGKGNIQAEADYNTLSERRRLRALNLTHYYQDHELHLGTFSYQPRGALADFDMLAIDFSTSLKTRVDLEHAFSSELVVYLTRRSVVRLVVDDRVYAGDSYPAGNQVLDTQALPDGTYEVEIRILDPVSGERSEHRLFTKSAQIPPQGETQYSLTAGVPLLFSDESFLPETQDISVASASMARRLTDQSAFWLGLLRFGSHTFLQTEFIYLGDRISFQTSASLGKDKTIASSSRINFAHNSITAALSYDYFEANLSQGQDVQLENLIPGSFRQTNFSISKALRSGYIGFRSSYRKEVNNPGHSSLTQYALFYRRPVFKRRHIQGLLETNLQQDDAGRRLNLQFRAFFNDVPLSGSLLSEAGFDEFGNNAYLGSLGVNWQHDSDTLYDIDLSGFLSTSDNDNYVGASASVEHPWFTSGFSTDWHSANGSDYRRSSIASLAAHAGVDARGLALGGADFAQAGVIISIKGEPAGETFDIVINGIKASTGEIGKPQFIGLQPFESYSIKLIPKTVLSNGIGENIYDFTLYPGNVKRIDAEAKKQVLLIATLVNKFGELVENAVIEREPSPLLVEEGGFFQAEVSPGERIIVKPANAAQCEFIVPESTDEDVLVLDQPLLCVDSAVTEANLH